MRRFFYMALFIAAATPAIAHAPNRIGDINGNTGVIAQMAPVPKSVPESGLTINDCLLILQGLERMDEKRTIVLNRGKPNESSVQEAYEFPKVGVLLDIAHNIALLNGVKRDAQPVQQKIFFQILKTVPEPKPGTPATAIPAGTSQEEEYNLKMFEMTSKPCRVQLTRINAPDLPASLPVSVLALIDQILDR